MIDCRSIFQVAGVILITYGGFNKEIVSIGIGVFVFSISITTDVNNMKNKVDNLTKRLDLKDEISELKWRVSIIEHQLRKEKRRKSKGQLDPTTVAIVIIIILILIWLYQSGILLGQ